MASLETNLSQHALTGKHKHEDKFRTQMGSLEGTYDTRLHEAVRYGDIEDTRMALQQGYDPNLIGVYQWSSLHEAAHNGELDILKLLLDKKGDPNRRDLLQGYTALHYAAREGHSDCLQLLVDKGGRYDVTDNNGNNSYDVATSECKLILDKQRVQDLMKLSPQDAKKQILEKSDSLEGKHSGDNDKHFEDLNASLTSESSDSHVTEDKKRPALGYVHLTFEYHAHKTTLKIRVWQISDLLLPPPNTSMIHSVYVKSYLMPDKKKDSKRKTEEVKVESSEAHYKMSKKVDKGLSVQHVFSPSTFKFSKPLEYTNITKEAVKEKSVQIEVCITQKYTKRSFLIGMYHMPLKSAIKKLVREKYPLIPCMNHTIPANMKVYCASELQITNAAKVFYSNPNVRNISNSDISEISGRAVSDPDIPGLNIAEKIISSVSVDVDSDSDAKMDSSITIPGEMENDQRLSENSKLDYDNIRIVDMSDSDEDTSVRKSAFKTVLKSVRSQNTEVSNISKTRKHSDDNDVSIEMDERMSPRHIEDWKYRNIKQKHSDQNSETDSRPQTPTWDYYDMTPAVAVDIPLEDIPSEMSPDSNTQILFPMETTLGVHKNRRKSAKDKDGKSHRKEKKKKKRSIPGKAVPTIIVTQDDEEKRIGSPQGFRTSSGHMTSLRDDTVTPSNVAVDLGFEDDRSELDSDLHAVKVVADVHVDGRNLNSPDISINIDDSDSFVIDLENVNDNDDEDISQCSQGTRSKGHRSRSELVSKHTIPMQVFIDDSIYDSSEEISEYVDKFAPFKPLELNDEVSEV